MPTTEAQIKANQMNSQKSTGPVTEAGAARSSQNATKHGLTAQTLLISPEERESYETHVRGYMDHHKPQSQIHLQLVQQLADSHWATHQVFVQQMNTMALMNAINLQVTEQTGDPIAVAAALAPVNRSLNTLSIYEGRRRRATKAIQQELDELEAQLAAERAAAQQNSNKPNPQPEIGFVHSNPARPMTPKDWAALADHYAALDELAEQAARETGTL